MILPIANWAAFSLVLALRFGWALVPVSFYLAAAFHSGRHLQFARWQPWLLLVLFTGWLAAVSGLADSCRRAGRRFFR